MKNILLFPLILSISFLLSIIVQAQTFNWTRSIICEVPNVRSALSLNEENIQSIKGTGISLDAKGNCYVIGTFTETADFGTINLTAVGSDLFLAKYDPNGNCLWAKKAGGPFNDYGYGVSADINGNSYIIGCFEKNADFGVIHLTADGTEMFMAKFDNNGVCLWAKKAVGSGNGRSYGISVNLNGDIYITGGFNGIAEFGSIKFKSYGYEDILIAKYDNDGNCLWAKQAGGDSFDGGTGICVDLEGNSYITGYFWGKAVFDKIHISGFGQSDIFVAKYDPYGNCIWAKKAGGTKNGEGKAISVDAKGNSYIAGHFTGPAIFGTMHLDGFGGFIAKYDSFGNCLWVKLAGNGSGQGISADAYGNICLTGGFKGTATFGSIKLTSYNYDDIFIAGYTTEGICIWAKHAGGIDFDYGYGISADAIGNCYATGYFSGDAKFDNINLSAGHYGAFITKINMNLKPVLK
jgi:hypothetical protein